MDGLLDHELHHTATAHHSGGNGRIRVHPAVVQILIAALLIASSALTGYYKGLLEQQQRNGDLDRRVSVLEQRAAETHDAIGEIKTDLRDVKRMLEERGR